MLYSIRCNNETLPFEIVDKAVKWTEGTEQCHDCGDVLHARVVRISGSIALECVGCGARYAATPFQYRA